MHVSHYLDHIRKISLNSPQGPQVVKILQKDQKLPKEGCELYVERPALNTLL